MAISETSLAPELTSRYVVSVVQQLTSGTRSLKQCSKAVDEQYSTSRPKGPFTLRADPRNTPRAQIELVDSNDDAFTLYDASPHRCVAHSAWTETHLFDLAHVNIRQ